MTQAAIEHLENNIRRDRSGTPLRHRRIELDFTLVKRESDTTPKGLQSIQGGKNTASVARKYQSGSHRKPPVY